MKTVKLAELEKQVLLSGSEPLSVEYNSQLIGYYYPVIDQKEVEKAAEKMDEIMEQVLAETGLTEEEFVTAFMNGAERSMRLVINTSISKSKSHSVRYR